MKQEKTLSSFYGIGQRINKKREELGLNQKELADKVNISFRTIQNYESNLVNPKIEVLEKLTNIFNCDLEYLIYGKTKQELISEEFVYFDSMYKNLEELEEINQLISNFNHELDNIENSKLRKRLISDFTGLIKDNIDWIEIKLKNQSIKENDLDKVSEINKIKNQINLLQQRVTINEQNLASDHYKLKELFKKYETLLTNPNKE